MLLLALTHCFPRQQLVLGCQLTKDYKTQSHVGTKCVLRGAYMQSDPWKYTFALIPQGKQMCS